MHAWITDNGQTPHVVVDAAVEGVNVPSQYVRDGKIVLNISHSAVSNLDIGNDALAFQARFSGAAYSISVPLRAVLGIYARETGRGHDLLRGRCRRRSRRAAADAAGRWAPTGARARARPGSRS